MRWVLISSFSDKETEAQKQLAKYIQLVNYGPGTQVHTDWPLQKIAFSSGLLTACLTFQSHFPK